jgi:NAD-dependent dihydropyrimidine dehydrogenase PreA subunit
MTYIIGEPCIGTKDTACVDACPVDCIHPKKDEEGFEESQMLYINPEECIDCGACEPACPVTAIWPEDNVPDDQQKYIAMNYEYYGQTPG